MNDMMKDLQEAFARRDRSDEQLRRFLADASHELRTPLTSIRGYAELFGRGASLRPDDLEKVMQRITQQSERMGVIVEDLLLLARLDQDRPLEMARVDLAAVAEEVVEDANNRQSGRVVRFSDSGPVEVLGDAGRLHQVVNNLVNNALEHTPPSASVSVSVSSGGECSMLTVDDDGAGIAEEDREHVFEPFYRASSGRARKGGGSGLGLAIVKAIVEAHGGTVELTCPAAGGSVFAVRLAPFDVSSAREASDAPMAAANAPAQRLAPNI
jgi:two-component system OmpR family sensor kinase